MIPVRRTKEILLNALGKIVLALGDLMLDIYLEGKVTRFSQEAPVAVIPVEKRYYFPGGSGNAAACMAMIGLKPHLVSVTGSMSRENYTQILLEECENFSITPHFILDPNRETTVKIRIAAIRTTKQHIARVDIEHTSPLSRKTEDEIIEKLKALVRDLRPPVITIHDYKKGLVTRRVFSAICDLSAENNIPIFADLKESTFASFAKLIRAPQLFFLKPNEEESAATAKILKRFDKGGKTDAEIIEVAKIIQSESPINVIITRGEKGAVLLEAGKFPYFVRPDEVEEQFDVAGAGDTVAAFLVAAYLGGATMMEALEVAVAASQVAIRKFGTSVVSEEELLHWTEYQRLPKKNLS